ncbi:MULTISPECIES: hypothetical protein [Clostridium]|uniref:hypothetical protein n=1 Tax=Clostridium TaxID=1485 RepID=UPI001883DEBD|nr:MULTISPECIES: hypothetical protein [Clostridium]MCR6515458.1 hypothetical protein [Clostridium sp. LY3-2]
MYIVFGNEIMDTKDIKKTIEDNTEFKVLKDMSKGTKREDLAAYNLSISIDALNEELEGIEIDSLTEDELFEEYLATAEEASMEIEEFLPEDSKMRFLPYSWDRSFEEVRGIILIGSLEIKDVKMMDILKRLLTQAE